MSKIQKKKKHLKIKQSNNIKIEKKRHTDVERDRLIEKEKERRDSTKMKDYKEIKEQEKDKHGWFSVFGIRTSFFRKRGLYVPDQD